MCYTADMNSAADKVKFLWGTPDEVAANARTGLPTFRLCRAGGEFPPVAQTLDFMPSDGLRVLTRAGRPAAVTWSDDDADYCLQAGVLPPDLAASRGEQAAAVFREKHLGESRKLLGAARKHPGLSRQRGIYP